MNRLTALSGTVVLLIVTIALTGCQSGRPKQNASPTPAPAIPTTMQGISPVQPTATAQPAPTQVAVATQVPTAAASEALTATLVSPAQPPAPASASASPSLQGTPWVLEAYGPADKPTQVAPQAQIDALFGAAGEITGFAGCNTYHAAFVVSGAELSVGPVATSEKACAQPLMQLEETYATALGAAQTFEITPDGKLHIRYAEGNALVFSAGAAPEGQAPVLTPAPVAPSTAITTTKAVTQTEAPEVTPAETPRAAFQPIRIQFPRGAISDTVAGFAEPGTPSVYVLRAAAGQDMTVQLTANTGAAEVRIVGADRRTLGTAASPDSWTEMLPASQDYYLLVSVPRDGQATNYTLTVSIVGNPRPEAGTPSEPVVVRFDPGTTTTRISGQVAPDSSMSYVVETKARQKLTIRLEASGPVRAAITDPAGTLVGVAYPNEPWAGTVGKAGEYRITVQAPVDVKTVVYLVDFTLK